MPDWLNSNAVMLPRLLQEAGYKTAHYGKRHLSNTDVTDALSPTFYGYDEFDVFKLPSLLPQMSPDSTMTRTSNFIEKIERSPFNKCIGSYSAYTPLAKREAFRAIFSFK
jgi:N-acetylgalactosamine-6-sulfatase